MINKIKEEQYKILDIADLLEESGENTFADQLRSNVNKTLITLGSLNNNLETIINIIDRNGKKPKKHNVFKKPKRITEPEVKEIEEYVDKCRELNVRPDYKYIVKKYEISDTIFYKIVNHNHKYSTLKEM